MTATANAKQDVEHLLKQLSDDATLEDIQYHVFVLEKTSRVVQTSRQVASTRRRKLVSV